MSIRDQIRDQIRERSEADNAVLLDIWHRAVHATHTFLGEAVIAEIYPKVRDVYLPSVPVWVYEAEDGRVAGFIGVTGNHVEMLFVDPVYFGRGIGTALLDHVKARHLAQGHANGHAPLSVDVNEHNHQAHSFYRRYGFTDVSRSATDPAGRPFPIIRMAWQP
ncbi:GNAT family N-acetyltransferase [Paraburkholderia sp. DHOC27]|uniref:GNAT family N-acetyltransferase n=1 Tax=Paraburkholderia sp. DHOC27 TaxID=2303330 RepID=UPI000E3D3DD9|nr:GNAT family N-acetyltransferase [Paraburkholderia sp. DHOC27]RFU47661.1 GNAT family N-acetyltransferase [Paraburkholderia sp. DHOC27]